MALGIAGLAPRRLWFAGRPAGGRRLLAARDRPRRSTTSCSGSACPPAWTAAARHVDATAGDGRAVVLPGQLYAYYDWGGTIDPILPALASKPVAVRNSVGYADLHATDLLWTVDALVQQRRALPGQLDPLLDLLGARTVVSGADDDRSRSGAAAGLGCGGRARRSRAAVGGVGARRAAAAGGGDARRPRARCPRCGPGTGRARRGSCGSSPRRRDRGRRLGRGRRRPRRARRRCPTSPTRATSRRPRSPPRARSSSPTPTGAACSCRRGWCRTQGQTLAADEAPSVDAAVLDPFARGSDAQTVAVYSGVRDVSAPSSPGYPQFPERRPFAAIDGDVRTHWQADRALDAGPPRADRDARRIRSTSTTST